LRLVRAANLTLGTDPSLEDLFRGRYEGTPPRVRVRGGLVTIEYGPRLRPGDWRRPAPRLTLNPAAPRCLAGPRAGLSAARLLGMEVDHAAASSELTLARPSGPVLLQFGGGTREVTIHRPVGTAARVKVTGGASGISFDDQSY